MGTNSGPEIANLTLYWDEARFVDDLQRRDLRAAQRYVFTYRLIDDVLSWGHLPPPSEHYGLEWKETTTPDGSCTFLGARLQVRPDGSLRTSVFDKAAEWNFPVIRTLARSATAFGVSQVCIVGHKAFHTFGSHGAADYVDFIHFHTLNDACCYLKEDRGCDICGVEIMEGAHPVHLHPFKRSTAFLLGNEIQRRNPILFAGATSPQVVEASPYRSLRYGVASERATLSTALVSSYRVLLADRPSWEKKIKTLKEKHEVFSVGN
ncbi:hypothetical protein CBR_g29507 [Chara braunii]|uniref:tRNA/rRNA methyltransferase SpoU type domain-containing protein n=1 Tax=Chara braunii TaxID=69332 RepID=A0A388LAL5_CHABU|nr:hypothetical protein CBR_g29507 [Chara braunii]|eukprot:GBG79359.1 hypothetical protein CBR_g29507 [Chara braunii]